MYQYNKQLKPYNSFGTEAFAKVFCEPTDVDQLRQCLHDHPKEQKLILGAGCNLFFTQNFDGLVIKPALFGIKEVTDNQNDREHVAIEVMGSENWDQLVAYCVARGYAGLENLSYIPGTVGASPVQNIGAYGAEVKDCIQKVVAIDMETLEQVSFSNTECQFAYRDSLFKQQGKYIIVSVVFVLKRSYTYTPKYADLNKELEGMDQPTIGEVRDAVIRIRQRKLPDEKVLPNCGSFFKNPYITQQVAEWIQKEYPDVPLYPLPNGLIKTSAAFLIDKAGYKGKQVGQIGTYPKQALIIVNYGSTDGNDIVGFMRKIQQVVAEKFKIDLEPEVRIL